MALNRKFGEADYTKFEYDLWAVLKNDPEHKVNFDGKMTFNSSTYGRMLAATDVHLDEATGQMVLVGAYYQLRTFSKDDPDDSRYEKVTVEVPLRECFEDLRQTSGNEMKLVSKAKKAVIDKYLNSTLNSFSSRRLLDGGILDLKTIDSGVFRLTDCEILDVKRNEEDRVILHCTNSFRPDFYQDVAKLSLREVQSFGGQRQKVVMKLKSAETLYVESMRQQRPVSMSWSQAEDKLHMSKALADVYDAGFPLPFVNAVARQFTGWDYFDSSRNERDIRKMMDAYRETGILKPKDDCVKTCFKI